MYDSTAENLSNSSFVSFQFDFISSWNFENSYLRLTEATFRSLVKVLVLMHKVTGKPTVINMNKLLVFLGCSLSSTNWRKVLNRHALVTLPPTSVNRCPPSQRVLFLFLFWQYITHYYTSTQKSLDALITLFCICNGICWKRAFCLLTVGLCHCIMKEMCLLGELKYWSCFWPLWMWLAHLTC